MHHFYHRIRINRLHEFLGEFDVIYCGGEDNALAFAARHVLLHDFLNGHGFIEGKIQLRV